MRYILFNPNVENNTLYVQQNSGDLCTEYATTMNTAQQYSPSKKVKRFRSAFTTDQVNVLEQQFKKFPYIGNAHRKEVAMALNIPERAIKIWFQNRRMKEKKESGVKEFDDDLSKRKSVEFTKDQSNNVSAPSANDKSLPLLSEITKPVAIQHGMMDKPYNMNVRRPIETVKGQHHRESKNAKIHPAPLAKNLSPFHHKGSAEFSINLCKKYKSEPSNERDSVSRPMRKEEKQDSELKLPSKDEQIQPEDLSSNRKINVSVPPDQAAVQGTIRNVPNPGYFSVIPTVSPLYAQPYIAPGGVFWKPISVMPVVSPGSSPVPAPNSRLGLAPSSLVVPKMNCNCDCHTKSSVPVALQQNPPNPQYVFTALPYHNPSAKF